MFAWRMSTIADLDSVSGASLLLSCMAPKSGLVSSSLLVPELTRCATVLEPQRNSLKRQLTGLHGQACKLQGCDILACPCATAVCAESLCTCLDHQSGTCSTIAEHQVSVTASMVAAAMHCRLGQRNMN